MKFPRGKMLISETTINCCKPNRYISFKGQEQSENPTRKVRYKHYEQMSDEVLGLRSILKAHNDVQKSNKMRLFKAMPEITTALLGTTIALAQPGKLAAKAGAGLGFLALTSAISVGTNLVSKHMDKVQNQPNETKKEKTKKVIKTVALAAAAVGAGALAVVGLKKTNAVKKVGGFIQGEAQQLTKEINETKLAKFMDEKIVPFAQKHKKATTITKAVAPFAVMAGSLASQIGLADSLSEDIKEKATLNFIKGKKIQAQAREHFDSIDAQEV